MDLPAQFGRNQILGPLDSIVPLSTVAIVTLSALQDGFCFAFVLLELSRQKLGQAACLYSDDGGYTINDFTLGS